MKKLFKFCAIALSAIFLSISANAAEGVKCTKGLKTYVNTKVNALILKECWNELDNASKKIQDHFIKSELFVFTYNGDKTFLYLSATKNSEDEMPAVNKGFELCAKDSDDCAVWSAHSGWELAEYALNDHEDDKDWIKHAMDRRKEFKESGN